MKDLNLIDLFIQVVLAAIGSSGIVLVAAKFLLGNFVQKRIDFYFNSRLEAIKDSYAKDMATLNSDLKMRADSHLEKERARYSKELEAIKTNLQKQANEDIERIKIGLSARTQDRLEILKLRREMCPPLAELIYRIRNEARDALEEHEPSASNEELKRLVELVIEKLFQFRIDLERDDVYNLVHSFKNTSRTFVILLQDFCLFRQENRTNEAIEVYRKMQVLYTRLDEEHLRTIRVLKSLVSEYTP